MADDFYGDDQEPEDLQKEWKAREAQFKTVSSLSVLIFSSCCFVYRSNEGLIVSLKSDGGKLQ